MRPFLLHIILLLTITSCISCTYSKDFTHDYYKENEQTLHRIRERFRRVYAVTPFAMEVRDRSRGMIGLEIHTDSIKYIYNFRLNESNLLDTLVKYKMDVREMGLLMDDMQKAHCTWITNLDYYEKKELKYLLFISVRDKKLTAFLKPEKYFTLAFFDQPQPYDEKGRLLDKVDLTKNRLINGAVFRKINDRVSYALTGKYR